jgi:hypothetical protein
MASLLEWLVKERCLWHAEPMFDRDLSGQAVFRCPRCMATWPILPDQSSRRPLSAPLPFEPAAARARRRSVVRPPAVRALASGR